MTQKPEHVLHISVNLDAAVAHLQTQLQETKDLVALGTAAAADLMVVADKVEGGFFTFDPAYNVRIPDVEDGRKRLRAWVLRNGFRDAMEAVGSFFEKVRELGEIVLLADMRTGSLTDLRTAVVADAERFHAMELPAKLKHLRQRLGDAFLPDSTSHLLSLNRARNCLVHRRGIVAERDTNESGHLRVSWTSLQPYLVWEGGHRRLDGPTITEHESQVVLRMETASRSFSVGTAISFTPDEFAHVMMSLYHYATEVRASLAQLARAKGVRPAPPGEGRSRRADPEAPHRV